MSRNKKNTGVVNDEVEELLRAAEDATLLKLSVNSHTVHPSASDLHPELDQRFRALKSGPKKPTTNTKPACSTKRMPPPEAGKAKEEEGEDDLFARFAALKASLPNQAPSLSEGISMSDSSLGHASKLDGGSLVGDGKIDDDDDDEEDEVEKIIRWAKDAARLDPSPPSDEDDDALKDEDYASDDDEKSDDDDDSPQKNRKGHRK